MVNIALITSAIVPFICTFPLFYMFTTITVFAYFQKNNLISKIEGLETLKFLQVSNVQD